MSIAPPRPAAARPFNRILIPALSVAVLSGCAPVLNPLTIASTVVDVISYASTGKGSADHVLSGLTEQDCALHRSLADQPVCQPNDEANSEDAQAVTDVAEQDPENPAAGHSIR